MAMRPLSALLLSILALLCYATVGDANGPVIPCCLKTSSTRVRLELLQTYKVPNKAMCHGLHAVSFITVKGATICSDPSTPWARKAMTYLKKKHTFESGNHASKHDSNKLWPTMP